MKKKFIIRISNELGNQLFMYASSFAIAKKLNRRLLVDNETAFLSKKNISSYCLNNFAITSEIANNSYKYKGFIGYLKRKVLKKINFFLKNKVFYIEPKDTQKITKYNNEIYNFNLSKNVYLEGNFETDKYFNHIKDNIKREFTFLDIEKFKQSFFYDKVNKRDSVSICLRQNRFIEGKKRYNESNKLKSEKFKNEQIKYINKSMHFIKNTIKNPLFYLWSNDLDNLDISSFDFDITKVIHKNKILLNIDKRVLDLFLISQCNHHIVIPSSFNWWGAWLCERKDKIICRPNENYFSDFKVNNQDFWPSNWKEIS